MWPWLLLTHRVELAAQIVYPHERLARRGTARVGVARAKAISGVQTSRRRHPHALLLGEGNAITKRRETIVHRGPRRDGESAPSAESSPCSRTRFLTSAAVSGASNTPFR